MSKIQTFPCIYLTDGYCWGMNRLSNADRSRIIANFCRIHQSLRVTPAMAAGISDHVWEISDLVGLLEREEALCAA